MGGIENGIIRYHKIELQQYLNSLLMAILVRYIYQHFFQWHEETVCINEPTKMKYLWKVHLIVLYGTKGLRESSKRMIRAKC